MKVLLLTAFCIFWCVSKQIIPSKVIVALNCGSKQSTVESYDKQFKYVPDSSYVSGSSIDVDYHNNDQAKANDIKFTFDKGVYMFERHAYKQMIYSLPVRTGKNTIILKFAEMYFNTAGQRVFDIKIGTKIVRNNFDVVEQAGKKFAAHEEYIEIDVRKDGVYYDGSLIEGALKSKKIKLSFTKGRADNPIINGIIVYHDSVENSPKKEFIDMKTKWETQKEMQRAMREQAHLKEVSAVQKKKEKTVIRNDQLIIEKKEETISQNKSTEKFGFIRKTLMGPVGVLVWSSLFLAIGLYVYQEVFKMPLIYNFHKE